MLCVGVGDVLRTRKRIEGKTVQGRSSRQVYSCLALLASVRTRHGKIPSTSGVCSMSPCLVSDLVVVAGASFSPVRCSSLSYSRQNPIATSSCIRSPLYVEGT